MKQVLFFVALLLLAGCGASGSSGSAVNKLRSREGGQTVIQDQPVQEVQPTVAIEFTAEPEATPTVPVQTELVKAEPMRVDSNDGAIIFFTLMGMGIVFGFFLGYGTCMVRVVRIEKAVKRG